MIIWGGYSGSYGNDVNRNDGARFNPTNNTWRPVSTENAPTPRFAHSAVWTGKEMLVWGGYTDSHAVYSGGHTDAQLNTGGRYDPSSDSWRPIAANGAPSKRYGHIALWTGKEMIVWGGGNATEALNDGARYDPVTDAWTPIRTNGAPWRRIVPFAVWTGREMIIWGGSARDVDARAPHFEDGARYNPQTDTWTPISAQGAPQPRYCVPAIWTGTEMLVWGGVNDAQANGFRDPKRYLGTGARYSPATDTWTSIPTNGAPTPRLATTVWVGNGLFLFGGYNGKHLNDTYCFWVNR
jgi:N-acetylneuraminic acid mutarotase